MKKIVLELYARYRNFVLYGIIGSISSSLDFLIYTLFVKYLFFNFILANSISVLVGIMTSFTLNRKYNFKVTDHTLRRFLTFFSVGISGLLLSNLILYLCVNALLFNKIISKLLSIFLVVILQFAINKYITFKNIKNG